MNQESKNHLPTYSPAGLTSKDYARAERFLPKSTGLSLIKNATVMPHWLEGTNTFWYQRDTKHGHEFLLVDAEKASKKVAFDHQRLAEVLSTETGQAVLAGELPITELYFNYGQNNHLTQFEFNAFERRWFCALPEYQLTSENLAPPMSEDHLASPDGSLHIFRRDFNLWVRNIATGKERPLTTDGEQYNEYGWYTGNSSFAITAGLSKQPPLVLFSPNGKKLVAERVDEREVGQYTLWQGAPKDSDRPRVHEARLPFAGDEHVATRTLIIFNLENNDRHDIAQPFTLPIGEKIQCGHVKWSTDSSRIYYLSAERYCKTLQLLVFDLQAKTTSVLIEESSAIQVNLENSHSSMMWSAMRILGNGDILWFSERTGWGHFYRYDKDGKLKNIVTQGDWSAYEITFIDERRELAYILGAGREPDVHPYYRQLYKVPLDGSGIHLLTPEKADHAEADQFHEYDKGRFFCPSGDCFVDTWSTTDTIPQSVLKTTKGEVILTLEEADISGMFADDDWPYRPEVFQAKARDGKTDIYGEVFKPTNFDPNKKYPVLDHIYSSPYYMCPSWPSFTARFWGLRQAYAELGFIVVIIHGLGTCGRSKGFHEHSYGNLQDSGIADHVTAIEQLAERHNYIDIDRVGILGGSTGGYNTILAMQNFPDFFKVGIAAVPGVDHPHLSGGLVERFQGPPTDDNANYNVLILANNVERLKGKLLLAFGDMDENVPMHTVVRFMDAMTKHNKDYDLIYLPNVDHWVSSHPYYQRRCWDYLVRYLMGSEPPKEYQIEY